MATPLYSASQSGRHSDLYVYHDCPKSASHHLSGPVSNDALQKQYNSGPLRRQPSYKYSGSDGRARSLSGDCRRASRASSSEGPSSSLARSGSRLRSRCFGPLQHQALQYGNNQKVTNPWVSPRHSFIFMIPAPVSSLTRPRTTRERPTCMVRPLNRAGPEQHVQLQRAMNTKGRFEGYHPYDVERSERATSQQSQRISSLNMDIDYGTLGATLVVTQANDNPFAYLPPGPQSGVQTENMRALRSQLRVVNDDKTDEDAAASITSYSTASTASTEANHDERRSSTAASTPPPAQPPNPPPTPQSQYRILRARMLSARLPARLSHLDAFAATLARRAPRPSRDDNDSEPLHAPWFHELDTLQRLVEASLQQGDLGTWDRILHLLVGLEGYARGVQSRLEGTRSRSGMRSE